MKAELKVQSRPLGWDTKSVVQNVRVLWGSAQKELLEICFGITVRLCLYDVNLDSCQEEGRWRISHAG